MKNCRLIVTYYAKENMREKFMKELMTSGVVDTIRQEDGCIFYDYYLSMQDKNIVLLLEKWESQEKLDHHLAAEHINLLRAIKEKYIEKTELQKIEEIGQ